ncbi:GntR family transcriptional regulator [Oceanobacillus massiliensis]|uniref:GntR family transcriptional regulator n=1 Tax=Oceanobacillus massiliensis TaxID=1465765 RepID=UPI000288FAEB|nr:GntR family transcriptional regulator [Oceanobacillus massiliensis]
MINSDLPIPLHVQISNLLEKDIQKGAYEEKIPSERELMDMFSVSRTTVREAVANLVNEGKLQKVHGKGTFISKQAPIQEWLTSLNSFTDTVKKMGMMPSSKLLFSGRTVNRLDVYEQYNEIFLIERLRFANRLPVAIERHYYPVEIGEKLANFDLNTATIYDLLENELHISLLEAEQSISSVLINEKDSVNLGITSSSNVLSAERKIYGRYGKVVEFYEGLYRPDMYIFRIKTKRKFK